MRTGPKQQAVEADLEDCAAEEDYENELADDWDCESATVEDYSDDGEPCELEVGDYEACVTASNKEWGDFYGRASCDDPEFAEGPELPAACEKVVEQCPDLL